MDGYIIDARDDNAKMGDRIAALEKRIADLETNQRKLIYLFNDALDEIVWGNVDGLLRWAVYRDFIASIPIPSEWEISED